MKGVASLDAMSRLALAGQQGIIASPLYITPTNIIIPYSKFVLTDTPLRGIYSSSSLTDPELQARRAPVGVFRTVTYIQFSLIYHCLLRGKALID